MKLRGMHSKVAMMLLSRVTQSTSYTEIASGVR